MNPNNAPGGGFMYFTSQNPQQSTPPPLSDTSDFLALTSTQTTPSYNNSDKLPRYRPSVYQNKWAKNSKSNNSNASRRGRFNDSFSPKSSFNNSSFFENNSSFNDSGNNSSFGYNSMHNSFENRGTFNKSNTTGKSFLHPSFMEDPWAELILKAERRKEIENNETD